MKRYGRASGRLLAASVVTAMAVCSISRPVSLWAASPPGQAVPASGGAAVPPAVLSELDAGHSQDLIVLFDDSAIEEQAGSRRKAKGIREDDAEILAFKADGFRRLKQTALQAAASPDAEQILDYSHLPMTFHRFHTKRALEDLLKRPEVVAVYPNIPIHPHLATSLPFIGQPAEAGTGLTGSGTSVAVIDTGVNYTLANFGSCTSPGVPAGCRVPVSLDVTVSPAVNYLNTDPAGHGSNVAGIVAGVAPGTSIISLNVFSSGSSSSAWVIDAINWAISNKSTYHISALNMSLGDTSDNKSPCSNSRLNPFVTPIGSARAAGILPVASSGNSAYSDGLAIPACTPGVVSVGAIYDAKWGGPYTWSGSNCTDSAASSADMIPCFSNSASFLTMLAPGAFVTASGVQMAGTSQASPHVAGAAAVLRGTYPADTLDQTVARMTSSGVPVTDSRNGVTTPRLNLLAALGTPANDNFANRAILSGDTGTVAAENANATKEAGEPDHAGNAGGKSVWWSWTPSSSGLATLDTGGSNFNTLLAVYTGSPLGALTPVAANQGGTASAVSFPAVAGTEYLVAVDGADGAFGSVVLNRSLSLQADLSLSLSSSGPTTAGGNVTFSASVTNTGPSVATGTTLTAAIPAGATFVSASSGCTLAVGTLSCGLGGIAIGGNVPVQIVLQANTVQQLDLTASVASSVEDPVSSNNSANTTLTISAPPPEPVPALSPVGVAAGVAMLAGLFRLRKRE